MKQLLVFAVIFSSVLININSQALRFSALFSDHMVLQQASDVPIWGNAEPNSTISITASWNENAQVKTNALGKWFVKIKTPIAGGPYKITVSDGKHTLEISDVLIGEVWICSGQSNMEMPLSGWPPRDTIDISKTEIANANNNYLRMFTVSRAFSIAPLDTCSGSWALCNSENVGKYSATAYFFGKKLYNELKVPIGLIHTSWGGTPAEAWTEERYLSAYPEFVKYFEHMQQNIAAIQQQKAWVEQHKKLKLPNLPDDKRWQNLDFGDMDCLLPLYSDSNWRQMELPQKFEQSGLGEFDGAIWFRRQVDIPASWENQEVELSIAMIDDMDLAFVNGTKVGGIESPGAWQVVRNYIIPPGIVKNRILNIAVRVIDYQGGGGIWGKPEQMYLKIHNSSDTNKISLAGTWRYLPVAEYANNMFYKYNAANAEYFQKPKLDEPINAYKPAVLFNAMVNPLIPYSIKGVIWYQGESNVRRALQYTTLFPAMINNWRERWDIGNFPFYYVQIAPWEYSGANNCESAWLRESQRRSMAVENTGMAVTLDIGNVANIHPGNKQDVGNRLALWAMTKNYGKNFEFTGPLLAGVTFKEGRAILTFSHKGNALKIVNTEHNQFEIAGDDGLFVPAEYVIEKEDLVVWSSKVQVPSKVRYAFKNGSKAALFNSDGLPASSFTTEAKIE